MNQYAKQKYYTFLIYKFRKEVEKEMDCTLPDYIDARTQMHCTSNSVCVYMQHNRYYISYKYLDKLRRDYDTKQKLFN